MMTLDRITALVKSYSQKNPELKAIGIYGSYAKGTFHEKSDIDIAILAKKSISFEEKIRISSELQKILLKEIDLVDLRESSLVLIEEIFKDAIWVKQEAEFFAPFVFSFLLNKEDYFPIYRRIIEENQKRFLGK